MITLKEIFDDLAYGEFAQMAIGKSLDGTITTDKYPKVVSFINQALLDLYSRFVLKKKECVIYQREGVEKYYVRSAYMGDPMAGDPAIYIDNTTDDPPAGDIIKFIEAFDELGEEIFIDDGRYPDDLFLVEPDVFKITPSDPPKVMTVVYQASYPKIIIGDTFDPATYELYIPQYIRTALLAKVASLLFTGKNSRVTEGEQNLSTTFHYRYEGECLKITNLSLVPGVSEDDSRFADKGWV